MQVRAQYLLTVSFAWLLLFGQASAENIFPHAVLYPAGKQPTVYALQDFNGDGKVDVLVINKATNGTQRMGVVLGRGNGRFGALVPSPLSFSPQFVLAGDIDGDGITDVLAMSGFPGGLHVLRGNGDGTFNESPTIYTVDYYPVSPVLSDLNGDGYPDVVFPGSQIGTFQYELMVVINKGDGTFLPAQEMPIFPPGNDLAVADFNRDGKMDLAVVSSREGVQILLGNGDGTFQVFTNETYDSGSIISAGDYNGDGIVDLAVPGVFGVVILQGNGDGTFKNVETFPTGFIFGNLSSADFNGDGVLDLFFDDYASSSIMLSRGPGLGLDAPITFWPGALATGRAVPGDINGDGLTDIVVGVPGQNSVGVLLNRGRALFDTPFAYSTGDQPTGGVTSGDFNGDGKMDVAIGGDVGLEIMLSQSNGRLGAPHELGLGAFGVVAADFNGDHKLDLVVTGSSQVELVLGNGDGTFGTPSQIVYGDYSSQVLVADFNGDHREDLAVVQDGSVVVLVGNGDGTFKPPADNALPYRAAWIVAADFNHDGHLDLAAAGDSSLMQLVGNGDGTFQPAVTVDTGVVTRLSAVLAADLNNDGNPDLVVTGITDPATLAIYMGKRDGSFQPKQRKVLHMQGSDALAVADFDHDGNLDLVVGADGYKSAFNCLRLLLGNGDGTFQPEQVLPYASSLYYWSVSVTDFNQDGWPDLLLSDVESKATIVLNVMGR